MSEFSFTSNSVVSLAVSDVSLVLLTVGLVFTEFLVEVLRFDGFSVSLLLVSISTSAVFELSEGGEESGTYPAPLICRQRVH